MNLADEIYPNVRFALAAHADDDLDDNWTPEEIWRWIDERLKRIAQMGIFVERAEDIALVANQLIVPMPADFLAALQIELDGLVLRPTAVREAEALDDRWAERACEGAAKPDRWIADVRGNGDMRPYPLPSQAGLVAVVYRRTLEAVSLNQTQVRRLPTVIADALACYAIAEARDIETDAQMPEVVAAAGQLSSIYAQAIEQYFGVFE